MLDLMVSEYRNDDGLIGYKTGLTPLVHAYLSAGWRTDYNDGVTNQLSSKLSRVAATG
jgi:hypothetical protein